MSWYGGFKPYVPVAKRRAEAANEVAKRIKKGEIITPVQIEGKLIASTFWGQAWCSNLESYSDFENRLPRGRTYARNGSIVHLAIEPGQIKAMVSGSSLYQIEIEIAAISKGRWDKLKKQCAGKMGSLVELLQGKLSQAVMELVTDRAQGLFPAPKEIKMRCSCPDYAGMCKHIAAVMYGVGNRLDTSPELLFRLRGVDHSELIEQAIPTVPTQTKAKSAKIAAADLGAIFDIEIDETPVVQPKLKAPKKSSAKPQARIKAEKTSVPDPKPKSRPTKQSAVKKVGKKLDPIAKKATVPKPKPKSVRTAKAKAQG